MFSRAAARSLRLSTAWAQSNAARQTRSVVQRAARCLSTQRVDGVSDSNHSLNEKSDKSVFARLWDKYSVKRQTNRIIVAESFLQAANHQASDPRWFGPGRIASDFRSYQALLTMHIWFLHKRLIANTSDPHMAALIQEELFDIFWTDTTCRMRHHGVNEWLIQKNLKTVQQYTFMHCFHYDHCYTEMLDKPLERYEELKSLVARHILLLNPDGETANGTPSPSTVTPRDNIYEDHLNRIVWYIEAQYQNIVHDMPEELFRDGKIAWVDLPDFSNMKDNDGKPLEDIPVDENLILPEPWTRNIANDGQYYYWNLKTRESKWERPK